MKHPLRTLVYLIACVDLAWSKATADVIVTTGTVAPTSSFADSTLSQNGLQWRWDTVNGLRDVGQSFEAPGTVTLNSLTFQIDAASGPGAGAPNAAFTLSLYSIASASALPTAGTAILTEQGTLSPIVAGASQEGYYVTFSMSNTVLTGGDFYAMILSFNSQAANENIVWQVSNTSGYAGGQAIISTDGSTFSALGSGADLVFYASAVAVPEPSPAMLLLPVLAVGAVMKFRSRPA